MINWRNIGWVIKDGDTSVIFLQTQNWTQIIQHWESGAYFLWEMLLHGLIPLELNLINLLWFQEVRILNLSSLLRRWVNLFSKCMKRKYWNIKMIKISKNNCKKPWKMHRMFMLSIFELYINYIFNLFLN